MEQTMSTYDIDRKGAEFIQKRLLIYYHAPKIKCQVPVTKISAVEANDLYSFSVCQSNPSLYQRIN